MHFQYMRGIKQQITITDRDHFLRTHMAQIFMANSIVNWKSAKAKRVKNLCHNEKYKDAIFLLPPDRSSRSTRRATKLTRL